MLRKMLMVAPLAAIGLTTSAHAYDPIVLKRGWQQIAYDESHGCTAEARSNGQFVYIYATGLGANATAHYHLANDNILPIDWNIQADGNGEWARYYIPFHGLRRGGVVQVNISATQCNLNLAFQWQRGIVVIDEDGTRHLESSSDYADRFLDF